LRKGWVEEKISLIVQNAFTPKETEVIARQVKRQSKKMNQIRFGWTFLGIYRNFLSRESLERFIKMIISSPLLGFTPLPMPSQKLSAHDCYQAFITQMVGSEQNLSPPDPGRTWKHSGQHIFVCWDGKVPQHRESNGSSE